MALTAAERANFETLLRAAEDGALSLLECIDTATGERRAIVCAVTFDEGEYELAPFAALAWDNPYELWRSPTYLDEDQ